MNVGVCSSDFDTMSAAALFDKAASFGFVSMQLALSSVSEAGYAPDGSIEIPDILPSEAIPAILAAARASGVKIAAVNGTFNMAHPDEHVRREGVRRFTGFADAVRDLGCQIISICTGTRDAGYLWRHSQLNDTKDAWADMYDTMLRIVEIAEARGLTLAIETEASNVVDTPEKARALIDSVGSHSLKMIMDCANLFHGGQAHPENVRPTIERAFEAYGRDVVLAHGKDIAESDGIQFCPTFEGIIDYSYFIGLLNKYGYEGDMLIHGVFDDKKMARAADGMRAAIHEVTAEN